MRATFALLLVALATTVAASPAARECRFVCPDRDGAQFRLDEWDSKGLKCV